MAKLAIATVFTLSLMVATGNQAHATRPADCRDIKQIRIEPHNTNATVSGGIARGEVVCLSLRARAGQRAILSIRSKESNAVFQFYRPGWKIVHDDDDTEISGIAYKGAADGDDAKQWSGSLMGSSQQLIVLGSQRGDAAYDLNVRIVP